jgi:hypothetical protein
MWVRALAIVLFTLFAGACSSKPASIANPRSLRILNHLATEQHSFGVILDARTGKALVAFRVNNPIRAATADGQGGWYIGGGFIHVNGRLRKRLAHIRADGTLDSSWRPEANGNGVSVTSLARIDSRLYLSGDFARLDRRPRLHLGALDVATGKLLSWQPAPRAAPGYAVLLAAGGQLYLGGYAFDPSASGLIALDPRTGRSTPAWHGRVETSNIEGGSVRILMLHAGRLYFAGMFGKVHGNAVPGLAAVDAQTGALARDWKPRLRDPDCTGCTEVGALAAGDTRIFAAVSSAVHALDPETGAVDPDWSVRIGLTAGIYGGAGVTAMARAGKRLYITGSFDSVNGARRRAFAAVDETTGKALPSWTPTANDAYGTVVVRSGSRVLLGIQLTGAVRLDIGGMEAAKQPFKDLKVLLALSGPGNVRIGLGRRCDFERWAETGRCGGPVTDWLGSVAFPGAGRKEFHHEIPGPPGRYFVRFVPSPRRGEPQAPYDIAFRHD